MATLSEFFRSLPWYAWIAIVGIIGGVVQGLVKTNLRHKERMAMIERGQDPDKI
jgi:hypothetical protein